MKTVTIIGGSGYAGGELLRILIHHPEVEVIQVTSRKHIGEYIYQVHPNLRNLSSLRFISPDNLESSDIYFLALPHGASQSQIKQLSKKAAYIIDLSADFRLNDPSHYENWYMKEHIAPDWLLIFVYGLPELHREDLKTTRFASGVGCNATACNLSLLPLINSDFLTRDSHIVCEIKVGSSEGGAEPNPGSHHPERSNVIRTYSPYGHRHTAEVIQELGITNITLTMTSVDLVRGALATTHASIKPGVKTKDIWRAFRKFAAENPFIRIVKEKKGVYRVPEPKVLAGSNYADLGFEFDESSNRIISICAIDNLMKGASGSAVQSMNLMLGLDETLGLSFPGLHPI